MKYTLTIAVDIRENPHEHYTPEEYEHIITEAITAQTTASIRSCKVIKSKA